MKEKKTKKTSKTDENLLMAIACGATVEVAAHKAGLSERTVYRRLDDPDFRRLINRYRSDMVLRSSGMLTAAAMQAVKTMLGLMEPNNPASVRLGASRAVLELGIRLREMHEVEERLAVLEEQMLTTEAKRAYDKSL
jgi:hypothetical protein